MQIEFVPGERTLKNLLCTALRPVGETLYVYGGGWNEEDTGASKEAVSIGLPRSWLDFFRQQSDTYDYKDFYPINGRNQYGWAGADCSGYLGWALYNVMNKSSGGAGYVSPSTGMAHRLAEQYGFGRWTQAGEPFRPGDLFSMRGHVWLCVGVCRDGSLVILHSTPSPSRTGHPGGGVQLSALSDKENCQALSLARHYMRVCCPEWSARYDAVCKPLAAYTAIEGEQAGHFSWTIGKSGLADPEGYRRMGAEVILRCLLEYKKT